MARARKTDNGGNKKMAGLTNDQIMALLSKTRTKGQYVQLLNEFLASGEAGVCVNDTWPSIGGKTASTIKQGFEGAKDKKDVADGAEKVIVKTDKDESGTERVYLINLNLVEVPEAA